MLELSVDGGGGGVDVGLVGESYFRPGGRGDGGGDGGVGVGGVVESKFGPTVSRTYYFMKVGGMRRGLGVEGDCSIGRGGTGIGREGQRQVAE